MLCPLGGETGGGRGERGGGRQGGSPGGGSRRARPPSWTPRGIQTLLPRPCLGSLWRNCSWKDLTFSTSLINYEGPTQHSLWWRTDPQPPPCLWRQRRRWPRHEPRPSPASQSELSPWEDLLLLQTNLQSHWSSHPPAWSRKQGPEVLSRHEISWYQPWDWAQYRGVGEVERVLQNIPDIAIQTWPDVDQRSRGVRRVGSDLVKVWRWEKICKVYWHCSQEASCRGQYPWQWRKVECPE